MYGVSDPVALKRINNLMNDHSLHSRQHLYIPVAVPAVAGCYGRFEFDTISGRQFVVVSDKVGAEEAGWDKAGTSPRCFKGQPQSGEHADK